MMVSRESVSEHQNPNKKEGVHKRTKIQLKPAANPETRA